MAMRYIIRRDKPENLQGVIAEIPNLMEQLGAPAEDFRRFIKVTLTPLRSIQYTFVTRKAGASWAWLCTSTELVAEDEKGLFSLMEKYGVPKPAHLAHLS